jgi:hypothetical protein
MKHVAITLFVALFITGVLAFGFYMAGNNLEVPLPPLPLP